MLVRAVAACAAALLALGHLFAAEPSIGAWPPPQEWVSWTRPRAGGGPVGHLQLLGFNDFHGNLLSPLTGSARPIGGAAALAAYLKASERAAPDRTLILHAGDQVGASPPTTRLLRNEPGIEFLNLL